MAVGDERVIENARFFDRRIVAGGIALAAIAILVGGAFSGLIAEASRSPGDIFAAFDTNMIRIARFTLWQALLSTLLSVVPAILVARALFRQADFFGRRFIVRLFAVPLALPAIVAALGILALYGRAGLAADLTAMLGLGRWPSIYGLSGILIAHVFFNLPLATRLFLEALSTVPADQHRVAAQLGLGARSTFRFVEWPAMRRSLPGVAGLVFMLCITSFTIVLTLGGGPAATTLEVAIYQSLRFDFEPARAVALTILQLLLTIIALSALNRAGMSEATGFASLPVARRRFVQITVPEAAANGLLIAAALLFVAGPMLAIVVSGLEADLIRIVGETAFRRAAATSLATAFLSAWLAAALSLALVAARRAMELRRRGEAMTLLEYLAGSGSSFVLVVPPIVIGAGWFALLRNASDVFALAPFMVVTVNAVMAMPFAVRALRPAYDAASVRHERLSAILGISGWARLSIVDWPVLRRPLGTAFAFAMALSLGDLGVIALFGSDQMQTLPYLLLARMGSYRTEDAAGLALLLGLMCLALVVLADRLGGKPT